MQCQNCSTIITQHGNYCPNCGERTSPKRLTVKSVLGTFVSGFYDLDNKLIKTFRHLFSEPETVIQDYIKGFRKNYVNVITYLSISLTLVAIQIFIIKNFYPEQLLGFEQPPVLGVDLNEINAKFFEYQGILVILFTPLSAFASWVVFAQFKLNFAEHIVLNVYPSAQVFITWFFVSLLVIGFNFDYITASIATIPLLLIYMYYVFKRVFNIVTFDALWRTFIYALLYFVLYMAASFIMFALYFFYLYRTGQLILPENG